MNRVETEDIKLIPYSFVFKIVRTMYTLPKISERA